MNFPSKIEYSKLILEQRTHHHNEALWQAINQNRDFIGQFLGWPHKMHQLTDIIKATDKFMHQWERKEKFAYCIMDKFTHELFGMIDIQNIDNIAKTAEIGYWLRQDKTGHGYMSMALNMIEKQIFLQDFHELRIRCDAHNKASIAVAQRAGYTLETIIPNAIPYGTEFHNREIYVKEMKQ